MPYRAATNADLLAIGNAIAQLRASGCAPDDEVLEELENFEGLLEILVPPSERA